MAWYVSSAEEAPYGEEARVVGASVYDVTVTRSPARVYKHVLDRLDILL